MFIESDGTSRTTIKYAADVANLGITVATIAPPRSAGRSSQVPVIADVVLPLGVSDTLRQMRLATQRIKFAAGSDVALGLPRFPLDLESEEIDGWAEALADDVAHLND
jgi:hypothetical protein